MTKNMRTDDETNDAPDTFSRIPSIKHHVPNAIYL
jgi:hypothetical protein